MTRLNPDSLGTAFQPTLHACLRYAQRVLGKESLTTTALRCESALLRRCRNGLVRLAEQASQTRLMRRGSQDILLLFRRTRCLVVAEHRILTLLVSRTAAGFGKADFKGSSLVPCPVNRSTLEHGNVGARR